MMSVGITTGKIYANYDEIIKRVENWVSSKNPRITGCEDSDVKARIIQRIVELTNEEYTQYSIKQSGLISQSREDFPESVAVGGLLMSTKKGKIRISIRQCLKNIGLFAVSWSHLLIFLVVAIFRRCSATSTSATILMEGGGYGESDSRFVKFCRQGPIKPLSTAKNVIVKAKNPPNQSTDLSFNYTSHPIVFLISNYLNRSTRISLLIRHLGAPIFYIRALITCPINVLISRDLSVIPLIRMMNDKNLIDAIIVTTSSFASQLLWMKGLTNQKFKLHMVWYSQNFIPKTYIGEETGSNLPAARHMRIDIHWVWTDGFKSYLRDLKQESQINVVGPILWYLPEEESHRTDFYIKVAVFDITPVSDNKTVFGAAKNYYSVTTIKKFVTDIVNVCDDISLATGKDVLILLKHKRMPIDGRHDQAYLEFLEQLNKSKNNFMLIDHNANLFDLLGECDLSISVPYTSTAYVAAYKRKPGIYYDPFAELIPKHEINDYVSFASGPSELRRSIESALPVT